MPKYKIVDGFRVRVGSSLDKWLRRTSRARHGQPPLKHPPAHTDLEREKQVVAWAHWGVANRGHFHYTMSSLRARMFHRRPGDTSGTIYADCSQFVASILHWVGVKAVTDTDATGSLLQKGKLLGAPRVAAVAIWGPGGGDHAAFITEKAPGGDWWTIGFGHQGAPDRVLLSYMNAYFREHGKPGVRFLNFL